MEGIYLWKFSLEIEFYLEISTKKEGHKMSLLLLNIDLKNQRMLTKKNWAWILVYTFFFLMYKEKEFSCKNWISIFFFFLNDF